MKKLKILALIILSQTIITANNIPFKGGINFTSSYEMSKITYKDFENANLSSLITKDSDLEYQVSVNTLGAYGDYVYKLNDKHNFSIGLGADVLIRANFEKNVKDITVSDKQLSEFDIEAYFSKLTALEDKKNEFLDFMTKYNKVTKDARLLYKEIEFSKERVKIENEKLRKIGELGRQYNTPEKVEALKKELEDIEAHYKEVNLKHNKIINDIKEASDYIKSISDDHYKFINVSLEHINNYKNNLSNALYKLNDLGNEEKDKIISFKTKEELQTYLDGIDSLEESDKEIILNLHKREETLTSYLKPSQELTYEEKREITNKEGREELVSYLSTISDLNEKEKSSIITIYDKQFEQLSVVKEKDELFSQTIDKTVDYTEVIHLEENKKKAQERKYAARARYLVLKEVFDKLKEEYESKFGELDMSELTFEDLENEKNKFYETEESEEDENVASSKSIEDLLVEIDELSEEFYASLKDYDNEEATDKLINSSKTIINLGANIYTKFGYIYNINNDLALLVDLKAGLTVYENNLYKIAKELNDAKVKIDGSEYIMPNINKVKINGYFNTGFGIKYKGVSAKVFAGYGSGIVGLDLSYEF